MNRQPEKITWNVMGMMNNSYFRCKARERDVGHISARSLGPTIRG